MTEFFLQYGSWTYPVLFLVIFAETGFVVTPFLPGDSVLFAVGALAATDVLNANWLFIILSIAAILGNIVNYQIGRFIGPKIFYKEKSLFFNKKYLEEAQKFYEKHGGKTIILTRFMPILRTFAPFVAGIGKMDYKKFFLYNIIGGLSWIGLFIFGGYYFGNIPVVKNNFSLVILGIIIISLLPAFFAALHQKRKNPSDSWRQTP